MKSIAFYLDEIPFVLGENAELRNNARQFVDKWCSMVRMTPIWIDYQKVLRRTNGNVFYSWEEMVDKFKSDHQIIFLSPDAEMDITNFIHPDDDVIYCIGADYDEPFGSVDTSLYTEISLPVVNHEYAFTVVPVVTTVRMMQGV